MTFLRLTACITGILYPLSVFAQTPGARTTPQESSFLTPYLGHQFTILANLNANFMPPPDISPQEHILPPPDKKNPGSGVPFAITPPPPINPINTQDVPLTQKEKRGQSITHHWRTNRAMPDTGENGSVVFTYGATQPSIVCAPLSVCLLKLEPGEHITKNGKEIGDPTEWSIKPTFTQTHDGLEQTILVIKPFDSALRTTLAIMTDRRIYSIQLVSVEKQERSMAICEFRYPEEEKMAWDTYDQQRDFDHTRTSLAALSGNLLDFHYIIGGDHVNWRPMRVYNDGTHTFIQLPDNIRSQELPILTTQSDNGQREMINYRRQGNFFVTDHLFERALLQLGARDHKKIVTITHKGRWN